MDELLNAEKIQSLISILAVVGAIVVAVPAVLRALEAIFKIIPGSQPDLALERVRVVSEKIAEVVAKLLPKLPGK